MRKLIPGSITSLCSSVLLAAACTSAGAVDHALPPGPYVSTNGEATVEEMPDYASVTVVIEGAGENAKDARDALDKAAEGLNAVIARYADAVGERKLLTVAVNPEFRERDDGVREFEGYRAEQMLEIRVDDLTRLNPLYYDLAALNTAGLDTPSYHVSDESRVHDRVRDLALEDARRNAEMLANSQGARLGTVWGIIYRSMHTEAARFRTGTRRDDRVGYVSASRQLSIPLEPQPIPYTSTVGVVYRIEPGESPRP